MSEKPIEKTNPELEAIAKNIANTAPKTITDELTGFLNDLKKKWKEETEKAFDLELKKAIEAQKLEINTVMRKTFGMDDNLPVTKGEVVDIIRKAALEASTDNGKKNPSANSHRKR